MTELPDDELDKLFRKSSEELDSQFDPSDWISLKKRLDKQDGKTPAAWFRKWWPFALLAVLIPAGFAIYFMNAKSEINSGVNEQKPAVQIIDEGKGSKGEKEEGLKGEKGREEENSIVNNADRNSGQAIAEDGESVTKLDKKRDLTDSEKENATDEEAVSTISGSRKTEAARNNQSKILPRSRSKAGGVYLEPNRSEREGGDGAFSENQNKAEVSETNKLASARKSSLTNDAIPEKNKSVTDENNALNYKSNEANTIDSLRSVEMASLESRLIIAVKELDKKGLSWKKPDGIEVAVPEQKEAAQPMPAAGEKQELAKWAVRFGYSPDLSSVGLKNFSKPRSAVSLLVEYAILNKVFVQTGIVRSVKEYNARAGEYIWPSKYPPKAYPDNVDGTCNILEVPLNFRYDLAQNEKARWFAGAGSSSYYMQKEKYVYNYKPHTYGPAGWKGKTGWFLFSHINASAGYEYRLSKKLSMLAEPYVRIPVKRVGYGKVNLFTTGIWISVRYTPVFK